MERTRRQVDVDSLRAPVMAILGWAHLLRDERGELSRAEVQALASRIAAEAARIEAEWWGTASATAGGRAKDRGEAVAVAAAALAGATSGEDALGILCEFVHDLGGWAELDHQQADTLVTIDFGLPEVPVLHAMAATGSLASQTIRDSLPALVQSAAVIARDAERNRLLTEIDTRALTRDTLTGLLDADALDRLARYLGPRHTVVALGLDDLGALTTRQGQAVSDLHVRRLGTLLAEQVRVYDYVFRAQGGDFVVVALTPGLQGALDMVDRMRAKWAQRKPQTGISVGVAGVRGRDGRQAVAEALRAVETRRADHESVEVLPDR